MSSQTYDPYLMEIVFKNVLFAINQMKQASFIKVPDVAGFDEPISVNCVLGSFRVVEVSLMGEFC